MVTAGDAGTRDSPPSSPRLRQTTFGATLDFIEALCDASSRLTSFPPVSTFHRIHRAIPAAWSVPSPLQECCAQALQKNHPISTCLLAAPLATGFCRHSNHARLCVGVVSFRICLQLCPCFPAKRPKALCQSEGLLQSSTGLLCRAQEDREWALKRGLDEINKEIEAASRADVACWFPMGTRDERIVRLAAKEAQLLNSRCLINK